MKKILLGLGCLSLALLIGLFTGAGIVRAANTVTVSGNTSAGENQPGWMFNRDTSTATPFEFNKDAASIGSGSLYVKPIQNTFPTVGKEGYDKFIAEDFINAPIASVSGISYDFKIGNGGEESDANQFYMSVYANFGVSPDNKFYDCRYSVVPSTGSKSGFTTVNFDPTQVYPFQQRNDSPATCPAKPADMGEGATIRAYAINVGDTSLSDTGLDGYLDKVVVKTTSGETTYDFEPKTEGSSNTSSGSSSNSVPGPSMPTAPQCTASKPSLGVANINVIRTSDTTAKVQWSLHSGDNTHIMFGEHGTGWHHAALNVGTSGEVEITHLIKGRTYDWVVIPMNGCAAGNNSPVLSNI